MRDSYPIYRDKGYLYTLRHDRASNRYAIGRVTVAEGIGGAMEIVGPWQSIKITKAARRLRLYAEEHGLRPVQLSGCNTKGSVSAATLNGARRTNQGHSIMDLREVQV